uniref:Uncharacterized protein n=1 Tax=Hyaloperonospora arabidopsidis (strain Emoy2) TaxID=559515 RepID=M4C433_HYAAE
MAMDKQYDDQGIAVHFLICVDANEKKRCIVWPSGIYKASCNYALMAQTGSKL